jgi:hypothetical protein
LSTAKFVKTPTKTRTQFFGELAGCENQHRIRLPAQHPDEKSVCENLQALNENENDLHIRKGSFRPESQFLDCHLARRKVLAQALQRLQ